MALDTIADLGARTVLITLDTGCYGLTREERPAQRFPRPPRRWSPSLSPAQGTC